MQDKYTKYVFIGGIEYPVKVRYKHVFSFYRAFNKELLRAKRYAARRLRAIEIEMRLADSKGDFDRLPLLRLEAAMLNEQAQIRVEFFFNILWKCLDKDGCWPWIKPFRSKKHMISQVLKDEMPDILKFISDHVIPLNNRKVPDQDNSSD